MSSTYSTITASVVQISAAGALGNMLTKLSSRTVDPFSSAYFSTKAFAHGVERDAHEETIRENRQTIVRNKFEISRAFDLVHNLVVVIDIPGIEAGATYVKNVGLALIEEATLSMGGHALATVTGGLLHCLEELGGTPGKEATALYDTADSTVAARLYVPMSGFWFTKSLSKALNIVGASFQRAYLDLKLNSLTSCINGVATVAANQGVPTLPMLGPHTASADTTLEARVTVDTHGITLNETDREVFSQVEQMTLMEEVHLLKQDLDANANIDLTSFAKNLVYEVIVATKEKAAKGLEFTGDLDTISMSISGQSRFPENMEAEQYNKVQPYIHHSQIPQDAGIYAIPFSFYPEDTSVPDSHVNCSKLDSLNLRLTTQEENREVRVFCLAYNILVEQRQMKARFFV